MMIGPLWEQELTMDSYEEIPLGLILKYTKK